MAVKRSRRKGRSLFNCFSKREAEGVIRGMVC